MTILYNIYEYIIYTHTSKAYGMFLSQEKQTMNVLFVRRKVTYGKRVPSEFILLTPEHYFINLFSRSCDIAKES